MTPEEIFTDMLQADRQRERRIFSGEIAILTGMLTLLILKFWLF